MHPASAIPGAAHAAAREAVHEVAPWIAWLARLGFAAKGLLYMTVGALATCAALRLAGTEAPARGATVGSRGAMGALLAAPAGHVLLYVMAAGLFCYAAWRLIEAIADPEHRGHGAKGLAMRVRSLGVAAVHVGLGYSALRIALGHHENARDGRQTMHWTAKALATPGGTWALYAIALGLVAYGLHQLYCAVRAKLDKQLSLAALSSRARRWVIGISRFGIAARGVVFIVTGGLVARAVRERDPQQAAGPVRSLRELLELGTIPFALIAIGLVAYGVYQLLNARYRRIQVAS
jgi:hypothetical protein